MSERFTQLMEIFKQLTNDNLSDDSATDDDDNDDEGDDDNDDGSHNRTSASDDNADEFSAWVCVYHAFMTFLLSFLV